MKTCECGKKWNECEHEKIEINDCTGTYIFHADKIASYDDMNVIIGSEIGDLDSPEAQKIYEKITMNMTVKEVWMLIE